MIQFSEQERKRYCEAKDAILDMIDRILEQETDKDWYFLTHRRRSASKTAQKYQKRPVYRAFFMLARRHGGTVYLHCRGRRQIHPAPPVL